MVALISIFSLPPTNHVKPRIPALPMRHVIRQLVPYYSIYLNINSHFRIKQEASIGSLPVINNIQFFTVQGINWTDTKSEKCYTNK